MSLFLNTSTGVGSSSSSFSFGNASNSTSLFGDKPNSLFSANANPTPNFFNQSQATTNLFGSGVNTFGSGTNSSTFLKPSDNQMQSMTSNMLNLPLQQRQELERIEKRKISLQKGLSLQMNPGMTSLTYQLDEKAAEKQQEVDNYIYYNLNDEEMIKNLNNAKKSNPNPTKCYTLPIKGFGELVQREKQQRKDLENLLIEMKTVKDTNSKILQTLNTNTLKRVDECKKRHQTIIHQLIHISCMIEDLGEKSNFVQINYQLDNQLNHVLHQIQENHMKLGIWQSSINQIENNIKCIEEHLCDNGSKNFDNFKNLFNNNSINDSSLDNKNSDSTGTSHQLKTSHNRNNTGANDNNGQSNSKNSSTNDHSHINNGAINDNGNISGDGINGSNDTNYLSGQDNRGSRDPTYSPTNAEIIFETLDNQQRLLESLEGTLRNDLLSLQRLVTRT